jgi:hypothetical protein
MTLAITQSGDLIVAQTGRKVEGVLHWRTRTSELHFKTVRYDSNNSDKNKSR